ncbi:MAG TPA: PilN domain-containing protein [Gemmatimonadales bacterium]
MITINLKPGSKRAKAASPFAGGLSALKGLPSRVKDPWPLTAVVLCGLTVLGLAWMGISNSSRQSSLATQLDSARSENRRYRAFLVEKRRVESARDSVIAQIATIRAVDDDRYVWPHILDEVTRAMPQYTWLVELATITPATTDSSLSTPVGVQMTGRTMDILGFTRFMRSLEDSPWLSDVTMLSTQTIVEKGRPVVAFIVKANYDRRGSAQARTAPITGER